MSADRARNLGVLTAGLGLIALGVLFLVGTVFQINIWGALWPLFRDNKDFATPSRCATNSIKAALALPSTGGAASRIFRASP